MYQQIISDINALIEQTRRKLTTYEGLIKRNNESVEALAQVLEYWFKYKKQLDSLVQDKEMIKDATR